MKRVRTNKDISGELLDHIGFDNVEKYVKSNIISSISKYLVQNNIIEIETKEDTTSPYPIRSYSTDFIVMTPEEMKQLRKDIEYLFYVREDEDNMWDRIKEITDRL